MTRFCQVKSEPGPESRPPAHELGGPMPQISIGNRWATLLGSPELSVALILTVFVFALSAAIGSDGPRRIQRLNLGAEYFNVARALADGRGFSDPFGEPTGPTAWVSP